jgi:hypothetical protein
VTLPSKAVFTFFETACRYVLATVLSTDYCKYTSRFECYIIVGFFCKSSLHRLLTMAVHQGGKNDRHLEGLAASSFRTAMTAL